MPELEIEKAEECLPMDSHIKENWDANGNIYAYPIVNKTASLKTPFGLYCCVKRKAASCFAAGGSAVLNLILVMIIIVLSVRAREPSPTLPTCTVTSCPNGWVGYREKCYYFAKAERNWTSSKMHCSSLNASLAVVDSQEEMEFMLRYKTNADHWIGLQRNLSQPWKYINGTIFNGWFTILGGGNCAYINQKGIASSGCLREEPWICHKPVLK
ncbi:C-type lectin domain family 2 member A-like [Sphaerodactylus townsendi]|uniref:C-type lectin domain family 2 member A-like n=1 Tax=Sphaerodactylus townsendi TaxID=933632 RepID=UPI002026C85C|nr:C-type lectin domain family 2 member A-like [Sphaerodactylus townsendi]